MNSPDPDFPAVLSAIHHASMPSGWDREDFARLLALPGMEFICADDKAFILFQVVADEAEIITLATRPEFRRQGYASELLEKLLIKTESSGVKKIFLEVAASNVAAISLYQKYGFTEIARRQGYYRTQGHKDEDAIVMQRRL